RGCAQRSRRSAMATTTAIASGRLDLRRRHLMSTCSAQGNIVSTTKTVKHLNARRRPTAILPVGRITFKSSFSVPAHRRNYVESSFQNSLKNFFRRRESYIAEPRVGRKGGDKHE